MARTMVCLPACVLLVLMVVVAEAKQPPKLGQKVYCKNPNYATCYVNLNLRCPSTCRHKCYVDCVTCTPQCGIAPPPPPPPPSHKGGKHPPPPPSIIYSSPPPPPSIVYPSPPPPPSIPSLSPPPPPSPISSPPPPTPISSPPPPPSVPTQPPPTSSPPPPTPISSPPPPPSVPTQPPPTSSPPPPTPISSPPPPPSVPTQPSPTSSPPPPTPISSPPPPPSIPTQPPPSSSPPPPTGMATCPIKSFENCYGIKQTCPDACPEQCEVNCVTCSPVCHCNEPGAICQDPRFVGADGLTFYFHGKKDRDFCIVSDSNLHINAHFIGKRGTDMMKRDFTWIQSIGILYDSHQIFLGAQKTSAWDDDQDRLALAFDGEPVLLPTTEGAIWQPATAPNVSITRTRDTNYVVIEVKDNFKIRARAVPITEKESRVHNYGITGEDCFAHLDLGFKFYSLSREVNGVLGQTYADDYVSKVKLGALMSVLGGEKEFASSTLFSADCNVARFNGQGNLSEGFEYEGLNCASEMNGRGVVCKR